jgi:hypothetical protein
MEDTVIIISGYLNRVYSTSPNGVICFVRNHYPRERFSEQYTAFNFVSRQMIEEGVHFVLEKSVFFYFRGSSFNCYPRLPRPRQAEYRSLEWPFFTLAMTPLAGQD